MILLSTSLKHYKREDIQKAMVEHGRGKEIAVRYTDQFGKRPDVLSHPGDILELAKNGATSFHSSEELWANPLQLDTNSERRELENLRVGWDLVLDIDCAVLDYSKIATDLIIKALQHYKIGCVSCKYSGNKGFHIGVPFEAFPERIGSRQTRLLFPDGARAIAGYLREMIKEPLSARILEFEKGNLQGIAEKTGKKKEAIIRLERTKEGYSLQKLDVESFLVIDTVLISSRHLYRMPYSLHEKSLLVSIPVDPGKVLEFDKAMAKPEIVKVSEEFKFLDRARVKRGEAANLLIQALDELSHSTSSEARGTGELKEYVMPETAIPEQFFPPCITIGLKGMRDGRKRFVFVLLNFLRCCGWEYERIEQLIKEWNVRNDEPLRETNVVAPLRYHKASKKHILPPNCKAMEYYVDMGICHPDNLCGKIRNPLQYAKRKTRYLNQEKKPRKGQGSEEAAGEAGKYKKKEGAGQDDIQVSKR
jgi:hypothetical protein